MASPASNSVSQGDLAVASPVASAVVVQKSRSEKDRPVISSRPDFLDSDANQFCG
jgi:hypothetical protein